MSDAIEIIQQAVAASKKVVITYNNTADREIDPISITRSAKGNILFTGHETKSGETRSFKIESITEIKLGESRTAAEVLTPENKALILKLPKNSSNLAEALPIAEGVERFSLSPEEAESRKREVLSQNPHVTETLVIVEGVLSYNISSKAKVYVEGDEDRFLRVFSFDYLSTSGELKAVTGFYPESVNYSQNTDNVIISGYIVFDENKISEYRSYNVENINNLQAVEMLEGDIDAPYTPAVAFSVFARGYTGPNAKLLRILPYTGGVFFLVIMYFVFTGDISRG